MTTATGGRHEGREGRPSGRGGLGRARAARAPRRRPGDAGRRVAVVGAGYVGLPTAAVLAHFGHRVVCAERDPARFRALRRGETPIMEPGLEELVAEGTASGALRFVDDAPAAVAGAEVVFLCVGTPEREDGSADLADLESVVEELAAHLEPGAVLVNKSTVPVGTALLVERVAGRPDIAVVSNPEFLREGSAVRDSLSPDRLVVGADDHRAAATVAELFAQSGAPLIVTDTETAETIKYASNAFLATKLSFVNSLAALCDAVGADVRDVVLGLGYDRRIGFEYVRPGPGWGGSCLPKDTSALLAMADGAGFDFDLLRATVRANDAQLARVEQEVAALALGERPAGAGDPGADGALTGVTVAVWGLTFKAGTDDRRSSPAVAIARGLLRRGATVRAYDPTVAPTDARAGDQEGVPRGDLDGLVLCADAYGACRGADAVALLTEWEELRALDFEKVREVLRRPAILDARNMLDPVALRRLGFTYAGLGRR